MSMPDVTPLCYVVTFPPQGERSAASFVPRGKRMISPLEGEMSQRDRGGERAAISQGPF